MASLKKLAGQTAWYGLSSIFGRLLNYLLTPYLTYILSAASYGQMSVVYALIPFMNVVYTYGMETTYFRFTNKENSSGNVYHTAGLSLILSTLLFTILILLFRQPIANGLGLGSRPEFITWSACIIALDTLAILPFARLRHEGRPRRYAMIKVAGILINIGLVVFFYSALPALAASSAFWARFYDPELGIGYYILANLAMAGFTLVLLLPQLLQIRLRWDGALWRQMMTYSLPIMVAGFGGMINEVFDRIMLRWWAPVQGNAAKEAQVGIYSACYKLSILITLFIQAFRLGAEPFFFQQARGGDGPRTYARVMKFFVLALCLMFLVVMLYLDVWKHFIQNPLMWEGLRIVPILLVANMCLGVYYNLSIWYKLSHRTRAGAAITFIGAGITLLVNYLLIPHWGYVACAWATLMCYGSMMLISYFWGQKVYPVPYATRRLLAFFGLMLLVYGIQVVVNMLTPLLWLRLLSGTVLIMAYLAVVLKAERRELAGLPLIGRYMR